MKEMGDYGVLERNVAQDDIDVHIEELKLCGYTALDSGLSPDEIAVLSESFDDASERYNQFMTGLGYDLHALGEAEVVRVLPRWNEVFFKLLFTDRLHHLLRRVLGDYYIVNQVNGLVNPANLGSYSQARFHRDLPFRHLTLSRPIAINALFALDDFTIENGATWVIPGSHTIEPFPSKEAVGRLGKQVPVRAGTFIVLDAMTYHAGGVNSTPRNRRAINHVFTIPAMRQQLHLPSLLGDQPHLAAAQRKMLGYELNEHRSYEEWFEARLSKA